jgi:hypothetical protein
MLLFSYRRGSTFLVCPVGAAFPFGKGFTRVFPSPVGEAAPFLYARLAQPFPSERALRQRSTLRVCGAFSYSSKLEHDKSLDFTRSQYSCTSAYAFKQRPKFLDALWQLIRSYYPYLGDNSEDEQLTVLCFGIKCQFRSNHFRAKFFL